MKKTIIIIVLAAFVSCKEEGIKKPNHFIEKETMINIMYDLSLFEAIRNQNPSSFEEYKINPKEYICKKYKIDSLQFAQNNAYYASDIKEYKIMFEKTKSRLDNNKAVVDALIKEEKNKKSTLKIIKPISVKKKIP